MEAKNTHKPKAARRPSGIAKATAAAAAARDRPRVAQPIRADPIEVGARAIYEMRPHPRKKRWDELEEADRAVYRERMRTIVAELKRKRYVIDDHV